MRKALFDNGIVWNGDALAVLRELPDESVDAVVTDPPYSSGGLHAGARQVDPARKYQKTAARKRCTRPCWETSRINDPSSCGRACGSPNAGGWPGPARRSWCFRTGGRYRP